jgi:D-amino-acid dehydrogenase
MVLGAGMVGVSTALHLQQRGWSVVLIDKTGAGDETSYGNAGIIQSESVEPYPMPRDLASLWAIATGSRNDVRFDPWSLPQHIRPVLSYWWNSAPSRHARISVAWSSLIAHATAEHDIWIKASGADDLVRRNGFRVLHRTDASLAAGVKDAEHRRQTYGVAYRVLSPSELAAAEPALRQTGAGAIHWLDPWPVASPGGLVKAYAGYFVREGGRLVSGDAVTLAQMPSGGWRVMSDDGPLEAETAVVALGPWSPEVLKAFGYDFPMVRKRGYHKHYRPKVTLGMPLMDAGFGCVLAPMERGLRITTGAELADRNAAPTPIQLDRAEAAARELLDLGAPVENEPWLGTRPCMPDMLPVIGEASRHKRLWFNFGHGHQGFTLGPATGRLLAEMMDGEETYVPAVPFKPQRWS